MVLLARSLCCDFVDSTTLISTAMGTGASTQISSTSAADVAAVVAALSAEGKAKLAAALKEQATASGSYEVVVERSYSSPAAAGSCGSGVPRQPTATADPKSTPKGVSSAPMSNRLLS